MGMSRERKPDRSAHRESAREKERKRMGLKKRLTIHVE